MPRILEIETYGDVQGCFQQSRVSGLEVVAFGRGMLGFPSAALKSGA